MIDLFDAALEVQQFCLANEWRVCIIGGLAVLRWGKPRTTRDVDFQLLAGFGSELAFIDPVLSRFRSRITDARRFAQESRVLLIQASNGMPIDVTLAGIPYEEEVVKRATPFRFAPDAELITCSAEDLVVMKAFAGREQDWLDVQGVLKAQSGRLDWDYVLKNVAALCELKEDYETPRRLENVYRGKP
jgi:hypothetical protein